MLRDLMVLWALLVAVAIAGCGGPPREARVALVATAHALRAADREVAPRYATAADEAREHAQDWAAYDAAMRPWDETERALRVAHTALLATQAGLDTWEAGDERGWLATVPCLVEALDRLRLVLEAVGVHLPVVTEAVAIAGAFAGRCEVQP
jgi:hypothetical protein